MSRTKRRIHPRTRQYILRVDINPKTLQPYPISWHRQRGIDARLRGDDGIGYGERCIAATIDRAGNWKIDSRSLRWGGYKFINAPQRVQRQANKIKCRLGLEDHYDELEEKYLNNLEWYDDEEMELPDWWYSPFADEYDNYDEDPIDTNWDNYEYEYLPEYDYYGE